MSAVKKAKGSNVAERDCMECSFRLGITGRPLGGGDISAETQSQEKAKHAPGND